MKYWRLKPRLIENRSRANEGLKYCGPKFVVGPEGQPLAFDVTGGEMNSDIYTEVANMKPKTHIANPPGNSALPGSVSEEGKAFAETYAEMCRKYDGLYGFYRLPFAPTRRFASSISGRKPFPGPSRS